MYLILTAKTIRSFYYENEVWTENSNEIVNKYIEDNAIQNATSFTDFSKNWWVFYVEDKMAKAIKYHKMVAPRK